MCFWDLTNILEVYMGYNYNDIPTLYYSTMKKAMKTYMVLLQTKSS
jgi:hypothetical protein